MIHPTLLHDMVTVERRVAELVGQRPTRGGRRGSTRPVERRRGVVTGRWWRRDLRTPGTATT